MATLGANVLTLMDWAKELDPDGKVARTVSILSQKNEMLTDMMFMEGNLPTGHRVSIDTGLPDVYWRLINQGVATSKGTTAQVDEQCAILEARSHADVDLAELNGNVGEYRMSQARRFLEAMSQEAASTLIYGSAASPEEIVGFANRYSSTSATNGENILLGGGSGADNASVYLIGWGEDACFGIFPKGSQAGIQHKDKGIDDVEDSSGNTYEAYKDLFKWKLGLVVEDWRYAVRIPNIDISDLQGLTGTQAITASTAVVKLMSRAIDHLPDLNSVRPVFYTNRTVMSHLRVMALEKSASAVTIEPGLNQFGQTIHEMRFLGIPVRIMDAMNLTESLVS